MDNLAPIWFASGAIFACSFMLVLNSRKMWKSIRATKKQIDEKAKTKSDVYEEFAKHVTLVHNEAGTLVAVTLTDEDHVIQRVLWEKR